MLGRLASGLLIPILLASVGLAQSARTPFDPPTKTVVASTVSIPITLDAGARPVAMVSVNGRGPYRMGIDWGANAILVSDRVVVDAGLPVAGSADAGRGPQPIYQIAEMAIGQARFQGVRAFKGGWLDTSVDGILGFNLFADLVMTFDFPGALLRLEMGTLPPADGREVLALAPTDEGRLQAYHGWKPGIPKPRAFFGDRTTASDEVAQPSVFIDIGGTRLSAVLDTRSPGWIVLPDSLLTRLVPEAGLVTAAGRGPQTGATAVRMARIEGTIALGRHRIERPPVTFRNRPGPIIGMDLLRQFAVSLDQRSGVARFARSGSDPLVAEPQPWERNARTRNAAEPTASSSYAGEYQNRRVTLEGGSLYLQRIDPTPPPGADHRRYLALKLKMVAKGPDEFGLEEVPEAVIRFERDSSGKIVRMRVLRDGVWETSERSP